MRLEILANGHDVAANGAEVARFYDPTEFAMLKEEGMALGFTHVESGPLVRSSYHAEQQVHRTKVSQPNT